ncbi:TetR/AcrR family transcriptional regulator [Streptomycetaceae bacterium NBC_01309]
MARPAGPGREALLRAGFRVAGERGLTGMSVNAVVEAAGMAKGAFYQHFADRRAFVVALHRNYHDELTRLVMAAVDGIEPGAARLTAGLHAYLDACAATEGTRGMLIQARTELDLIDETRSRNAQIVQLCIPDVAAVGWSDPEPITRMMVAMIGDVGLHELFDGRRHDRLRAAVLELVVRSP